MRNQTMREKWKETSEKKEPKKYFGMCHLKLQKAFCKSSKTRIVKLEKLRQGENVCILLGNNLLNNPRKCEVLKHADYTNNTNIEWIDKTCKSRLRDSFNCLCLLICADCTRKLCKLRNLRKSCKLRKLRKYYVGNPIIRWIVKYAKSRLWDFQ